MSDQQSDQQQNAEIQAHNAVADALHNLNVAQTANNNRRQVIQGAQEQLDAAHAQLAEARTTQSSASNEDDESLS
ncbi:hypothetical protein HZF08_24720 [Paenibacillus sp. CGMCC 1.16610]|uniref:Uncharacterized protein n=2 Tax=Paenibacillus TaxID=44249 RepID=A0ABU6DD54_9BACL|nr:MULTISPECIES: hypothetical protein [Paenibacillus]MBA2941492.1 hypothetical protein [Paenibacillus sp. CGMCC 1.16610]MCY9662152.1 hypothetical protein [Paenibacillus anseongense]MEB4795664.1 hypothetical protein [Paenibacillus chondroitinus]MVQ40308.1 hypothetical protein [Paenibacillus anseongense]